MCVKYFIKKCSQFVPYQHKNPHFSGVLRCWRRKRDLNPRYGIPYYSLSRGAPSASWVFLHSRSIKNDISISIVAHNAAFVKVFLQNFCRAGINPNKGCIRRDMRVGLVSISCCVEYITSQKASRRKASANL